MIGRLLRPADFERVLGRKATVSSRHFAMHYLGGAPDQRRNRQLPADLSTASAPAPQAPVDQSFESTACWLGMVVPKRHARRAVTRNLVKRLARDLALRHVVRWPSGQWVLRLRSPIAQRPPHASSPMAFRSAVSDGLRQALRQELDALFNAAGVDDIAEVSE